MVYETCVQAWRHVTACIMNSLRNQGFVIVQKLATTTATHSHACGGEEGVYDM